MPACRDWSSTASTALLPPKSLLLWPIHDASNCTPTLVNPLQHKRVASLPWSASCNALPLWAPHRLPHNPDSSP